MDVRLITITPQIACSDARSASNCRECLRLTIQVPNLLELQQVPREVQPSYAAVNSTGDAYNGPRHRQPSGVDVVADD